MSEKIKFSSPEPTGAIISQFYLALEKCFEMLHGECVYIEKDGDVSKINLLTSDNGEQLELKEYSENSYLTDSHLNFWNTLNNWTNPKFDSTKYKFLILATTQDFGSQTLFSKWNSSNVDNRKEILNEIYENAKLRFASSKRTKQNFEEPDSLKLMTSIFSSKCFTDDLISKIIIDSKRTTREGIVNELKEKHLKAFEEKDRDQVINSMLGFIINEEVYNKGWEIEVNKFNDELQDLSTVYNNESKIFPVNEEFRYIPEDKKNNAYVFVKKIEDIEHHLAIPKSLNDYWFTFSTIANEFRSRSQKMKSIRQFQEELIEIHNSLYSTYSRKCLDDEIIPKSKDFYDDIIQKSTPNFDIYNNTPLIFKNGMYHLLAEEDDKIVWKLKQENNE